MNTNQHKTYRCLPLYLCLSVFIGGDISAAEIKTIILDLKQIESIKDQPQELQKLLKEADKLAKRAPKCVTEKKTIPPSGDKRDYVSLAPYWFPDPARPDGLPYIRKDGKVNPESNADNDSDRFADMAEDVLLMARAWHLGRNEKHAAGVAHYLRAFFLDPATGMNPNVQFGQLVRGRTDVRGEGILELRQMMEIVDSLRLIEGCESWSASDRNAMNQWLEKYLLWLETSPQGADERAARNNHGSWYAAQYAALCLHLKQTEKARAALEQIKTRIAWQIAPDGSMPLELVRTKSLDYSIFNLRALFMLAVEADIAGLDLWHHTPPGFNTPALRQALDLLLPYSDGKQKWPHPQITQPKLEQLIPLLQQAAEVYHDLRYADLAKRIPSR